MDAGGNTRVLFVDSAVSDAMISGLTITGGSAAGGGILNEGKLSLVNVTISGNTTTESEKWRRDTQRGHTLVGQLDDQR